MDDDPLEPSDSAPVDSASVDPAATTPGTEPPLRPVGDDVELLQFAESLELTARDLYQAAIDAGAGAGDTADVFMTLLEDHEEYANAFSGLLGVDGARNRDDAVFDELMPDFDTDDVTAAATAGYDLESAAIATHLDLLGRLRGVEGAKKIAALLVVEARHATVLAHLAGHGGDWDALLGNDAESLAPAGGGS
ncbi:hypothetical protein BH24ACT5_BH24ACT5_13180 [soil metagenome]